MLVVKTLVFSRIGYCSRPTLLILLFSQIGLWLSRPTLTLFCAGKRLDLGVTSTCIFTNGCRPNGQDWVTQSSKSFELKCKLTPNISTEIINALDNIYAT